MSLTLPGLRIWELVTVSKSYGGENKAGDLHQSIVEWKRQVGAKPFRLFLNNTSHLQGLPGLP